MTKLELFMTNKSYTESEALKSIPWVRHAFFTRCNGVSQGLYAGRNCGPGSNDDPQLIQQNRERCAEDLLGIKSNPLTPYQIHSNSCVDADNIASSQSSPPEGDALVTQEPQRIIGILTADCVPILFADRKKKIIAAAHSGWKGAFSGIIQNTIQSMCYKGSDVKDIIAATGPSIAQKSYEVSADFRNDFLSKSSNNRDLFISAPRDGFYLFDLKGFVHRILSNFPLFEIDIHPDDTYAQENLYYSYRRMTHRAEPDYGRQMSAISIA